MRGWKIISFTGWTALSITAGYLLKPVETAPAQHAVYSTTPTSYSQQTSSNACVCPKKTCPPAYADAAHFEAPAPHTYPPEKILQNIGTSESYEEQDAWKELLIMALQKQEPHNIQHWVAQADSALQDIPETKYLIEEGFPEEKALQSETP